METFLYNENESYNSHQFLMTHHTQTLHIVSLKANFQLQLRNIMALFQMIDEQIFPDCLKGALGYAAAERFLVALVFLVPGPRAFHQVAFTAYPAEERRWKQREV